MISAETLIWITWGWMALAIAVHILLFFVTAPFGRHTSDKWGPVINNKLGWMIMELPSLAIMLAFLLAGTHSQEGYVWVLFAFWIFHYTNRSLIYPLRIRSTPRKMPLMIAGNAIFFNLMNAGLNGYFLAEIADPSQYGADWLRSPHFIAGAILFVGGAAMNWAADHALIHLRKPGESGYRIPQGWLFRRVSCPNLLGEVIEWGGFALMAWNLPALSFFIWTYANLVPRAKKHHDWYRERFPEYPAERRAVIPFLF